MDLAKQRFLFVFSSLLFLFSLSLITTQAVYAENHDKPDVNGTLVKASTVQKITIKSPAADLWRAVRQRNQDASANNASATNTPANLIRRSQVKGSNSSTLINVGSQAWRNWRVSKLIPYSMYALSGSLLIIILFRLIRGKIKIKAGRSGHKIKRFTRFQRFVHWSVAILFVILGITGVIMTLGRYGLLPLLGKDAFSAIAGGGKLLHDYLGPLFGIMLIVMLFTFIKGNFFNGTDIKWFLKGGGLMGGHASAGRYNGGEKAWYWIAILAGAVVVASGFILDFPALSSILELSREDFELSQKVHAVGAIALFMVSFGHIYMGTVAMEGAFEAMQTGECDTNWAKEHHDLWYEELQQQNTLMTQSDDTKY